MLSKPCWLQAVTVVIACAGALRCVLLTWSQVTSRKHLRQGSSTDSAMSQGNKPTEGWAFKGRYERRGAAAGTVRPHPKSLGAARDMGRNGRSPNPPELLQRDETSLTHDTSGGKQAEAPKAMHPPA